ncbi:hypothetical protein Tco_0318832 [Tanacetum coccineum]
MEQNRSPHWITQIVEKQSLSVLRPSEYFIAKRRNEEHYDHPSQMDVKHCFSDMKLCNGVKQQAPRAWNDTLSNFLMANKYLKGVVDPTTPIPKIPGGFLINQCENMLIENLQKYRKDLSDPVDTPMWNRLKTGRGSHKRIMRMDKDSRRRTVGKCSVSGDRLNTYKQNVPAQTSYKEPDKKIVPSLSWLFHSVKSNLLFRRTKESKNPIFRYHGHPEGNPTSSKHSHCSANVPASTWQHIRTNYVYQPWRAILSLLNQCLTGKTSGSDKPRHPVLQMLWGIVTQTNVDHAELIWEEFTQGIQTFFSHKASHQASLKNPKKKVTPLLIPYGRFSKVIIYYLASNNNIHRRPYSAVHHTGDDSILGNLKFVPKGESVEVCGMAIPDKVLHPKSLQPP